MIIDGWVNWATSVRPEIRPDKRWAEPNRGQGIVWHSQEGTGVEAMFQIQRRDLPPSFMFWISREGKMVQFAPVTASVWCSGNREANVRYWPVEMEGRAPERINAAQLATCLRLIGEWRQRSGLSAERGVTMWEHREVATRWTPNAGPTSCPGNRYAPLWAALQEEDMSDDQVRALVLEFMQSPAGRDAVLAILRENGYRITTERLNEAQMARWSHVHVASGLAVPPLVDVD